MLWIKSKGDVPSASIVLVIWAHMLIVAICMFTVSLPLSAAQTAVLYNA